MLREKRMVFNMTRLIFSMKFGFFWIKDDGREFKFKSIKSLY